VVISGVVLIDFNEPPAAAVKASAAALTLSGISMMKMAS
jgi:hypothetical protein